jgi:hypothetical protein
MLVTLSITTRVVVEDDKMAEDNAVGMAIDKIRNDCANYVIQDNVSEIIEDTECPYGTFEND